MEVAAATAADLAGDTDAAYGLRRWSELEPGLATRLGRLHSWATGERHPVPEEVERALADDGIIPAIVERFDSLIGLWTGDPSCE